MSTSSTPSTDAIRAWFSCRLAGSTVRKDGTGFDWAYDVIPFAPPQYNIAVYHEDERRGITELHLIDGRGEWSGPSVSFYEPEVAFDGAGFDRGEPYVVRPARMSASTMGSTDSLGIRAQARMLEIAAQYADAMTEQARPALEAEARQQNAGHQRQRAEAQAERERSEQRAARRVEKLRRFHDGVARVTATGEPTRVGTLRVKDDSIMVLAAGGREHKFSLRLESAPKVEVKGHRGGRYTVALGGGDDA